MFPYCCYSSSWVAFFYFLTTFYNFFLLQALFILLFHSSCLNKLVRCLLNAVVRFLGNQFNKWLCYDSFKIMLWKYFQNCMYSFRENREINITICHSKFASLQSVVVFKFTEIEGTFPVPFWDYVANCLWLRDMVSICLLRKGKYDWFLHERLLLHWLIFLLYLLQFAFAQNILPRQQFFCF